MKLALWTGDSHFLFLDLILDSDEWIKHYFLMKFSTYFPVLVKLLIIKFREEF